MCDNFGIFYLKYLRLHKNKCGFSRRWLVNVNGGPFAEARHPAKYLWYIGFQVGCWAPITKLPSMVVGAHLGSEKILVPASCFRPPYVLNV